MSINLEIECNCGNNNLKYFKFIYFKYKNENLFISIKCTYCGKQAQINFDELSL